MCPMCLTTAVMIAGSITSACGFTALATKRFGMREVVSKYAAPARSRLFRNKDDAGEMVPNANQRRDEDVNERD